MNCKANKRKSNTNKCDWNDTCDDRGSGCQRIPENHNEDVCHNISVKRRNIICKMKKLIEENYERPVCEQWDTECSLNNTKGPYRFGRIEPDEQHQELIGSQLIMRCDCGKRNGLQDDCKRWNCQGSPECKTLPFPKCRAFLGMPSDRTIPAYNPTKPCYMPTFSNTDTCGNCDAPVAEIFHLK